ncbi:hypothetical protein COMNV_01435 [Commensalibacter sp. Nvir]|uniref:hypothetical protein n=1 Tax=Commensalibacter sp. Nvir TaxID=3069817 RepID=UPI002D24A60A|nr:hypothetical protein COMNV_01435 [Commensalibacter sp. Nvir]
MVFRRFLLSSLFALPLISASVQAHDANKISCPIASQEVFLWQSPVPQAAVQQDQLLNQATIVVNKAYSITLKPKDSVHFIVKPARLAGNASYAGMLQFNIAQKGIYRFVMDSKPWVEIVGNHKKTAMAHHQCGKQCNGIMKAIDFALDPGQYILEISGNGEPTVKLMIKPVF